MRPCSVDAVGRDAVRRARDQERVLPRRVLRDVDGGEEPHAVAHRDQVFVLGVRRLDQVDAGQWRLRGSWRLCQRCDDGECDQGTGGHKPGRVPPEVFVRMARRILCLSDTRERNYPDCTVCTRRDDCVEAGDPRPSLRGRDRGDERGSDLAGDWARRALILKGFTRAGRSTLPPIVQRFALRRRVFRSRAPAGDSS